MPRKVYSSQEEQAMLEDTTDTTPLTPEGEYEIPSSMEEMLLECGLSFEDYYRDNYE